MERRAGLGYGPRSRRGRLAKGVWCTSPVQDALGFVDNVLMRFVVGQGQARGLRAGLFKVLLGVFALVIAVRVTMAENWAVGLPLGAWGLVETVTRAVVVASVGGHSYLLQFFFLRPALFGAIFSGRGESRLVLGAQSCDRACGRGTRPSTHDRGTAQASVGVGAAAHLRSRRRGFLRIRLHTGHLVLGEPRDAGPPPVAADAALRRSRATRASKTRICRPCLDPDRRARPCEKGHERTAATSNAATRSTRKKSRFAATPPKSAVLTGVGGTWQCANQFVRAEPPNMD